MCLTIAYFKIKKTKSRVINNATYQIETLIERPIRQPLRISSCKCKFKPKRILARITESQLSRFGHLCRLSNIHLPKRILMEWSLVPTDKEDQGRDGKMISLQVAPSSRLKGMLRIGIDGLILFMEPTSFGTRCKER